MKTIDEAAFALAMSRRVGFDADRSKRIGASEIGRCGRAVMLGKFGIAPDDSYKPTSGFAVRGDVMEDNWSAPLVETWVKANGGELLYAGQANQITLQGKNVPLSATPDGLAIKVARDILKPFGVADIGKARAFVPELKSIDPNYRDDKLPKDEHVSQTLAQLGMIRMGTEHKPEWGAVVYIDASDYFKFHIHPVKWEEKRFKGLVVRAKRLLAVKDPNQIPPEGKIAGGRECNTCPWAKQCLGFLPWVPDEDPRQLPSKDIAEVEKTMAKVYKAKQAVEDAAQSKRDAEAELFTVLANKKRRFVMGKKYKVSATTRAGQNRYDIGKLVAALKKKGGDPEKCRALTKPGASIDVALC